MAGPNSLYSSLLIHICSKADKEDRMGPPIHIEYLRSGRAHTLTLVVFGVKAVLHPLGNSWNMVLPPRYTVKILTSVHITLCNGAVMNTIPNKDGWRRASGQQDCSLPMVIT